MARNSTDHKIKLSAEDNASGRLKQISFQMKRLQKEQQELNKKSVSGFQKMKTEIRSAASALGPYAKGLAVVGAASTAAAAAVFAMVKETAKHNDEMGKMAERLGTSSEFISSLGFAAELSGKDVSKVVDALTDLNEKIVNSEDKFKKWGVATRNANGTFRNTQEVLRDVADRMSQMQTSAERVAMANDLMSSSGRELVPMLQQGAAGIDDMMRAAEAYGASVTTGQAAKAAEFNDALLKFTTAFGGLARELGTHVMPILTEALEDMADTIRGLRENVAPLKAAFDTLVKVLMKLPSILAKAALNAIPLVGQLQAVRDMALGAGEAMGLIDEKSAGFARHSLSGEFGTGGLLMRSSSRQSRIAGVRGVDKERREAEKLAEMMKLIEDERFDALRHAARAKPTMAGFAGKGTASTVSFGPAFASQEQTRKELLAEELKMHNLQIEQRAATAQQQSAVAQMQAAAMLFSAGAQLRSIFELKGKDRDKALARFGLTVAGGVIGGFLGGPPGVVAGATAGSASGDLFIGRHEGGMVPMIPGASIHRDSVPMMLTPGERVLSREQNAQFEGSMRKGAGVTINIGASIPPDASEVERIVRDSYAPATRRLERLGAI